MGPCSHHQFLALDLSRPNPEGLVHSIMEPNRQEHDTSGLGPVSAASIEESQPNPTPAVRRPRKQSNPKKYIAKPAVLKPRRKTTSSRSTQTAKTTKSRSTQTDKTNKSRSTQTDKSRSTQTDKSRSTQTENLANNGGLIEVYMDKLMVIRGYGPGYVVLRTDADGDETMEYFLG